MEMIVSDTRMISDLFQKEVHGSKRKRKRFLFLPPGAKRGVRQAGILHAFADHGIPANHFDTIVGTSCGSFNGLAYCAGKAHLVCEEYVRMRFICLKVLVARLRALGLEDVSRTDWPRLLVGVSDLSGTLDLENVEEVESALELCRASSSPFPLTRGVFIHGKRRIDGAHADPCPIMRVVREARRESENMDFFVVACDTHPRHASVSEWALFHGLALASLPLFSLSLCTSTRLMDAKISRIAEMAAKAHRRAREYKRIRICIIFASPKDSISTLEWRESLVRRAGIAGYEDASRLLDAHRRRALIMTREP